jgi:hypothetical protein
MDTTDRGHEQRGRRTFTMRDSFSVTGQARDHWLVNDIIIENAGVRSDT